MAISMERYDTCYKVSAVEETQCAQIYWLLYQKVHGMAIGLPAILVATTLMCDVTELFIYNSMQNYICYYHIM